MIRRDIFSVKVWDSAIDDYCHQHMTKHRDTAIQLAKNAILDLRCQGRPDLVKIVHPSQQTFETFLHLGNKLR